MGILVERAWVVKRPAWRQRQGNNADSYFLFCITKKDKRKLRPVTSLREARDKSLFFDKAFGDEAICLLSVRLPRRTCDSGNRKILHAAPQ